MEAIIQEISTDGLTRASVFYSSYPENPRTEWSNFSHMICEHRRYLLGDQHDGTIRELQDLCDKYGIDCYGDWREGEEDMTISEMIDALKEHIVIRLISLYDHSGLSIWYGSPCCPWDSGYVGFGYMEKSDVEAYGIKSDDWRNDAIEIMDSEMNVYSRYVSGEVYDLLIETRSDEESEWEESVHVGDYYQDPHELVKNALIGIY